MKTQDVTIVAGDASLPGDLSLPAQAAGLVVFAHGSGSSRKSPRNRYVAEVLNDAGLGTLLFDLLTPDEDRDYRARFDIPLLAGRLQDTCVWLTRQSALAALPLGLFGASTGAAAALIAAAHLGTAVKAVVSRGGRPDLAPAHLLAKVTAPTRLIVGALDEEVLALNRSAAAHLRCEHDLVVVPGATHLFEEPGTLEQAAESATRWLRQHLAPTTPTA